MVPRKRSGQCEQEGEGGERRGWAMGVEEDCCRCRHTCPYYPSSCLCVRLCHVKPAAAFKNRSLLPLRHNHTSPSKTHPGPSITTSDPLATGSHVRKPPNERKITLPPTPHCFVVGFFFSLSLSLGKQAMIPGNRF